MKNKIIGAIAVLLLLVSSCASFVFSTSVKGDYDAGRYTKALKSLVEVLEGDKNFEDGIDFLPVLYPKAVEQFKTNISSHEKTGTHTSWDAAVAEYRLLHNLNSRLEMMFPLVKPSNKQKVTIQTEYLHEGLENAIAEAAQAHYKHGLKLKKEADTRPGLKEAIKAFQTAMNYKPGFKDSAAQIDEVKEMLMNRIIIISTRNNNYYDFYVSSDSIIGDKILSQIINDSRAQEYNTVLSRNLLNTALKEQELSMSDLANESTAVEIGSVLGANLIITINVNSVFYKEPVSEKEVIEATKEIAVKDSKTGETELVEARIEKNTKTASATVLVSYKIVDVATLEIKKSEVIEAVQESVVEWATFIGDERALSREQVRLVAKKEYDNEPPKNLIIEATNKAAELLAEPIILYIQ